MAPHLPTLNPLVSQALAPALPCPSVGCKNLCGLSIALVRCLPLFALPLLQIQILQEHLGRVSLTQDPSKICGVCWDLMDSDRAFVKRLQAANNLMMLVEFRSITWFCSDQSFLICQSCCCFSGRRTIVFEGALKVYPQKK